MLNAELLPTYIKCNGLSKLLSVFSSYEKEMAFSILFIIQIFFPKCNTMFEYFIPPHEYFLTILHFFYYKYLYAGY
jgi:hypothetical protein